jgi:molybdenum cofactor cytidylyltransferase
VHHKVLVLGHEQEKVLATVNNEGFEIVQNEEWKEGQSTSVQVGLEAVIDDVEAAIFPLGDMPKIDSGLIDALIDRHAETLAPIVAPQVEDEWGNPVLFDRRTFPAFSELTGDRGAKKLFAQFDVEGVRSDPAAAWDVDHPEDIQKGNS